MIPKILLFLEDVNTIFKLVLYAFQTFREGVCLYGFFKGVVERKSGFSISQKLWILAIGVIALIGVMVTVMSFQTKAMLSDQITTLGNEVINNGSAQVDQYFSKLKALTESMAETSAELFENGATVDDDFESIMERYYQSLAKKLNILDLYVGLETTGKLGTEATG